MEREGGKNYKCYYSPTPAAQFFGLRRAGEVEFVIIARQGGWLGRGGVITKRHSSIECSTKGHEERSQDDHLAVLAPR